MVCVIVTDWLGVCGLLKVILRPNWSWPTISPGAAVVLEMLFIISRRPGPHLSLVARPPSWSFAQRFATDLGPTRRSFVTELKLKMLDNNKNLISASSSSVSGLLEVERLVRERWTSFCSLKMYS